MLFISLEQETHNSKAWQGGREVGRQSGGRKKERMEPQPLSEKLTLRPEPRVRGGYRGEERGGRRQEGDQSSLATKTPFANGSPVA